MSQELMPCPFCGDRPRSGWQGTGVPGMDDCGYWGIDCCNAFAHADTEDEAAAQWNTRPTAQAVAVDDELHEAAKAVNALYPMHWDRVDGSAVIMPERVAEFEERFARLDKALQAAMGGVKE